MMRFIKKIITIILIVSMLIDTIPKVEARATVSFGESVKKEESSGGGGSHTEDTLLGNAVTVGGSTKSYSCSWGYSLWDETTDMVSVYDMDNVDIIQEGFVMDKEDYPKAGTAVGLSIKERRLGKIAVNSITLKVVTTRKKQVPVYECKYVTKSIKQISLEEDVVIKPENANRYRCLTTKIETESRTTCPEPKDYCKLATGPTHSGYKDSDEIETIIKTTKYDFENGKITTEENGRTSTSTNLGRISSITINDSVELDKTIDCINMASIFLAYPEEENESKIENYKELNKWMRDNGKTPNAGNWQTYTKASYDVYMTDSNDANASDETIVLPQDRAQSTGVYYDWTGKQITCYDNEGKETDCKFVYIPGEKSGNRYQIGEFKVNSAQYQNPNNMNKLSSYLLTYYSYQKDKTCMNVKTGKVSYVPSVDSNGVNKLDCDPKEEVVIENEIIETYDEFEEPLYRDSTPIRVRIEGIPETQWHYFIPLNIKSSDGIKIKYQDHFDGSRKEETCINALKKYYIKSDGTAGGDYKYTELLRPLTGISNFVGDYICLDKCGTDEAVFRGGSKDLKRIEEDNGCYSAGEKTFSTKQLFYNEYTTASSGEKLFKGFNFYYKPINVGKENQVETIFPNGIKTNASGELLTVTLWDDWYKDQTTLDLSKSFETKSYVAYNINASEIRKYNQDNLYTSWHNMNINGTSNFINHIAASGEEEKTGIIRYASTNRIYKLGCGPANKDEFLLDENGIPLNDASGEKITNPLYIKGCEMP